VSHTPKLIWVYVGIGAAITAIAYATDARLMYGMLELIFLIIYVLGTAFCDIYLQAKKSNLLEETFGIIPTSNKQIEDEDREQSRRLHSMM
jgi:hypothetical protein